MLQGNGEIVDSAGYHVTVYPDVPQILEKLHAEGYVMAVASRTSCIEEANELVELLQWNRYFTYKEIYPSAKTTHFEKFRQKSGIPFKSMLFFDDEHRNIVDVGSLGVTCILAEDGVSHDVLKSGLETFARKS
ncbi:magnesium-dependent phosphatase 1-like isoform X2 [Gigantopelta aegis]|nr:magnesium-dependent phosphatase 1-like isoform X2 [Gigantopelta aegis]